MVVWGLGRGGRGAGRKGGGGGGRGGWRVWRRRGGCRGGRRGGVGVGGKMPEAVAVIRVFMMRRPGMKLRRPKKPRLVPPRFAARRKRRSWEGVAAPRPWMMPTVKTELRS